MRFVFLSTPFIQVNQSQGLGRLLAQRFVRSLTEWTDM